MRTVSPWALALAVVLACSPQARAEWPEKPIKVIVPFAPGGNSDSIARAVERAVAEEKLLPQPIAVVNIAKHFSIGAIETKNAPPDGHTFLLLHTSLLTADAAELVKGLSYRDFAPVAMTGASCMITVVAEDAPHRTLGDLMQAAREKPNTLLFGANIGAINHLVGVMLEQASPGAKFRFVQIGGGADNYAALKGKQTQVAAVTGGEYQSFKAGGLRALATSGASRDPQLPEVPTAKEQGFDVDFCLENYWFAPKRTPVPIVAGFAAELEKAMRTERMRQRLESLAITTAFQSGPDFTRHLDATYERIAPTAKLATRK